MNATETKAAWFIRPQADGWFAIVAKDGEGHETVVKHRMGLEMSFRTVEKAREFIRATYRNGTSFPPIRTGSDSERSDQIRFGALYC